MHDSTGVSKDRINIFFECENERASFHLFSQVSCYFEDLGVVLRRDENIEDCIVFAWVTHTELEIVCDDVFHAVFNLFAILRQNLEIHIIVSEFTCFDVAPDSLVANVDLDPIIALSHFKADEAAALVIMWHLQNLLAFSHDAHSIELDGQAGSALLTIHLDNGAPGVIALVVRSRELIVNLDGVDRENDNSLGASNAGLIVVAFIDDKTVRERFLHILWNLQLNDDLALAI